MIGRRSEAPRRLSRWTARPPFDAASAILSGAGEGSFAAWGSRNRKALARPPSAAICRRRSSAYFGACGQASTAPQAFEASACSVAHSVSLEERVRTMTSFAMSMPAAASAGA